MVSWFACHDPEGDWIQDQRDRWGALPLGESPKYVPSLSEPLSSAAVLLSGNAHPHRTDAGRGSESEGSSTSQSGVAASGLPPAAPDPPEAA